jgi:hypothetical protein
LLLLIIQFLFFPWVGGQSVQGAMLVWPRVVCESTTYRLAHLWSMSSQAIWMQHLVANWEPSCFLCLS